LEFAGDCQGVVFDGGRGASASSEPWASGKLKPDNGGSEGFLSAVPITLEDKLLLNKRNIAETVIGHIKEFLSLRMPKHRSVMNAFTHLLAAITAYQLNPIKKDIKLNMINA
jgi:hypothetical protein